MKLWMKILIALAMGIIVGLIFGERAEIFKPIGTIFLNLINMVIVLLVLSSMTVGISRINDPKKLGRVGLKTLLMYLSTTVIAIVIGLFFASWIQPGVGIHLVSEKAIEISSDVRWDQMLLGIIPTNPIASLVSGNVIQIIVFALFLGVSISFAGERGRPLLECMEALAEIMYRITTIVMEFSPYGVFAIMASVAGSFGADVLWPLAKFVFAYYIGACLHLVVVFVGILVFIARIKPMPFFRGMTDAMMVAFSTGSSSATLPVSLQCTQDKLGVSKNIASFVLPLGCTVNMNGTAMFQAMSALFISQAYEIPLDAMTLLTIILTATLSAIGAAGIPGAGFIMLSAVLSSAGLPLEGLAILAGIDRLRDMIGTVLNTLGDAVVAVTIAKQEGELDEGIYNLNESLTLEESEV